uniref:Uncharacterized protein n=1 Tax=Octopus bimaculoides TaxID=37653 RepID=A0A0L8IAG5_OCTBM
MPLPFYTMTRLAPLTQTNVDWLSACMRAYKIDSRLIFLNIKASQSPFYPLPLFNFLLSIPLAAT